MKGISVLLLAISVVYCVKAADANAEAAIRKALDVQTKAWNSGDLPTFVSTYAAECSYLGTRLVEGRAQVLARYRERFPNTRAMGKLRFRLLGIHDIDPGRSAYVIGEFHLDRDTADGGPADGMFSLVFHRQNGEWLIVLDHSHGS